MYEAWCTRHAPLCVLPTATSPARPSEWSCDCLWFVRRVYCCALLCAAFNNNPMSIFSYSLVRSQRCSRATAAAGPSCESPCVHDAQCMRASGPPSRVSLVPCYHTVQELGLTIGFINPRYGVDDIIKMVREVQLPFLALAAHVRVLSCL
jgi:hypothetical protein